MTLIDRPRTLDAGAPTPSASARPPVPQAAGVLPVAPTRGRLRPLSGADVRIDGGVWAERQEVNGTATVTHIGHWLEREGWLANFDLAAAGTLPRGRRGREFSDSEVYKYLESLAWEIGRTDESARAARLEEAFRATVARVAAAQEPDGYLNTRFGRPGQEPRWSDLEWGHELYCLGHLLQAAVARARTRPGAGDGLLDVARRAADLVCVVFGPGGLERVCGHAEIEPALVELSRVLGDGRYLEQARLFVERRGTGTLGPVEWGQQYFQDDAPVRATDALRGHAVRANYLAAGAVDVAVETGDTDLLAALGRQWGLTVARRTYVTGGQGSHHQDEAFGTDWVLPPDRAYSETCAGIASIMFSWRLALATGEARYSDLVERTLYNVVATSTSRDGTTFYYANTLHQRVPGVRPDPDEASPRAESSLRAPWFDVSCCPPNVARTLASLDALVATADEDGVQLHQLVPATLRTALPDGTEVALEVRTDYPRRGLVVVTVAEGAPSGRWTLSLRVPAWAHGARLTVVPADDGHVDGGHVDGGHVDGGHVDGDASVVPPGWAVVRRVFHPGDRVELDVPVQPRLTRADHRVDAVRGCVAVERGPEVYCLESPDLVDASGGIVGDVADVELDLSTPVEDRDGRPVVHLRALAGDRTEGEGPGPWVDAAGPGPIPLPLPGDSLAVPLVPYHDWAERGPSTMRVWLPVAPSGS